MSMYLNFEPHSWYMGFAIKKQPLISPKEYQQHFWQAYTDDGNTYRIVEMEADTLKDLKLQIRDYWRTQGSVYYNNRMRKTEKQEATE